MGKRNVGRGGGNFSIPQKHHHPRGIFKKPPVKKDDQAVKKPPEPKPPVEERTGPSKKQQKRLNARKRLLEAGKIEQTTSDLAALLKKDAPVVMVLKDCQDEAELRSKFHSEGTAGATSKYFSASKYKFRFLLTKDGEPVCQISDKTAVKGMW
mmetsp:Transcript_3394/g.12703  ORF Transcript_3394/g.12703 Transcript_3394/m.12703 type:complete len:153 (+) Transcript_3394:90-548(+)